MARAQGARSQMAAAFESTYGTAPSSGSYWKMPFATSGLGAEQPLLESELLGYGRDPLPPVKDAITADGDVTVPVDLRFLGIWLKGLFGAPTTTEDTGVYTHAFHSGGWALPSLSIEIGNPEVPSYRMNKGCVVNSMRWQMARSGLVTSTMSMIAQDEVKATSSAAGTLHTMGLQRFGSFNGAVTRDASALGNVVSAEITYTNNLDPVEVIRSDGLIAGVDPSVAMLSGTIDVRFDSETLLDQAINGTDCALSFKYQIDADRSFELVAHSVYLPRPKISVAGPAGIQASFAWQAALDGDTGRMATVTLINDVADYDNPS